MMSLDFLGPPKLRRGKPDPTGVDGGLAILEPSDFPSPFEDVADFVNVLRLEMGG
jgi:hypothetical protein